MPEAKKPVTQPKQPESQGTTILEDAAKSTPDVPKDELGRTIVPSAADTPAHLRGRLTTFDRPMGAGPPLGSPVDPVYQKVVREYLSGAGWEEIATDHWRDPKAAGSVRGEKQTIRILTEKDGKTDWPLQQLVVSVPNVAITTQEALSVQRMRDAANERDGQPTPLERIDQLERQVDERDDLLRNIAAELGAISKRRIPDVKTPDHLRAEVVFLRRVAEKVAALIRPKQHSEEAA
ncbi:MAG: hypothetical protein KGL39_25735 [Patescibacteria group bacterium]|nr:hypothetical protein [Patescibacteria group bacterium]